MYQFSIAPREIEPIKTTHRCMNSPYPTEAIVEILKESRKNQPASMNDQLPIVWDRAKGYQVFDSQGNCWIDLTSTIFVANVGHSHPKVVEAIEKATKQDLLNAYYYPTTYRNQLANLLLSKTSSKLNNVLFLSTGSEATEASIKMMSLYGAKQDPVKNIIIGFEGAFHGKTMGSQMVGGKEESKKWIGHKLPNFLHLPYPYPWVLEEHKMSGAEFFHHSLAELKSKHNVDFYSVAGFMAEPYQGWCAIFFPQDYMETLRKWASDHQALLCFDEIQAGFGRTGEFFGFECYGIKPDIICCGKALSSSIPTSAVIAAKEIIDIDPSFNSTHGGNPIGMAASIATLKIIEEENLIETAKKKGDLIESFLEEWQSSMPKYISEFYGAGVVWGVFVRDPKTNLLDKTLVDKCIERAMLKGVNSIRTCSGTLKLGPPITIPDDALLEGLKVLKESLEEVIEERDMN